MSKLLEELFQWYSQDFDLLFDEDTGPVDEFWLQHTGEEERKCLLVELKLLYSDIVSGKGTLRDIRDMGLEYQPGGTRDPKKWLPMLIEYVEERLRSGLEKTS